MLGREATTFSTDLDYFAMADALRTGNGLAGTIEFYPEEGKFTSTGTGTDAVSGLSRNRPGRTAGCV